MLTAIAVPSTPFLLTSRQHPIVRAFREAARTPGQAPAVLLDGVHVIREALEAAVRVRTLLVGPQFLERASSRDREIVDAAERRGAAVHHVSAPVLDAASPVRTPSGVVALAEWSPARLHDTFAPSPTLAIALVDVHDVQDPGNVGAVIRCADALGATGVVALGTTAHPGGWKALRGAMGSTFRLPVARGAWADVLPHVRAARVAVLATVAEDGVPVGELDWRRPSMVLVGNEGAGLPQDALADADQRVMIPMRQGVNSLNVSITAALVLYEARRQRLEQ
jgi:TrmH family RNA methyltransferase